MHSVKIEFCPLDHRIRKMFNKFFSNMRYFCEKDKKYRQILYDYAF